MPQVLNDLILFADEDGALDRGLVRLWVTAKKTVLRAKPGFLASLTSRDTATVMVVRTGHVAEDLLLTIDCRHLASGMTFGVDIRLRLLTPEDDASLQVLAAAFFRDDLVHLTRNQPVGPNTVEARVRRELTTWLQRELGAMADPKKLGLRETQMDWQARVSQRIAKEYGLRAEVALRFIGRPVARIDLKDMRVTAKPSDSRIDVTLGLRVTIEPMDKGDPFAVLELTEDEARELVSTTVQHHVQDKITLAQLRFPGRPHAAEPGSHWRLSDTLQAVLNGALAGYNRSVSHLDVEVSPPRHAYTDAEQSLSVEGCNFTPAGWDGKDSIAFRADVRAQCVDPALFEPLLEDVPQRLGSGRDTVVAFMQEKLAVAFHNSINASLFEVHRQDRTGSSQEGRPVGYADLLENWYRVYDPAIQRALAEELGRIGWTSQSIIARPMRDEMKLLSQEGAVISLSGLELESATPGAKIAFSLDVPVSVRSFADIQHILNRHVRPLDHIRDQIILPACTEFARRTPYLQFFQKFDFGPDGTSEGSFSAGLAAAITSRLVTQKLNVSAAGIISVRQTVTPLSELWTSITRRPDWEITTRSGILKPSNQLTLQAEISFTAKIVVVADDGWGLFARYEDTPADDQERGLAVQIQQALEKLGESLTDADAVRVVLCRKSEEDAAAFRALIKARADAILKSKFGLIADIVTASRADLPHENALLKEFENMIEAGIYEDDVETATTKKLTEVNAANRLSMFQKAAERQEEAFFDELHDERDPEAIQDMTKRQIGRKPKLSAREIENLVSGSAAPAITDDSKSDTSGGSDNGDA